MQIKSLEAELKKQGAHEKMMKNGEEVIANESYLQLVRNEFKVCTLSSRLVCKASRSTTVREDQPYIKRLNDGGRFEGSLDTTLPISQYLRCL